jgi:hypothetical protein
MYIDKFWLLHGDNQETKTNTQYAGANIRRGLSLLYRHLLVCSNFVCIIYVSQSHFPFKIYQYTLKKYYNSFGWRICFPENSIWNTAVPLLSYAYMFQVEICSQQLEICKSVCMFIVLTIVLMHTVQLMKKNVGCK